MLQQIVLSLALIGAPLWLAPTPAAAQYSSNYGGNCERPLVAWRGAHMPCDGYGPRYQQLCGGYGVGGGLIYIVPAPPPPIFYVPSPVYPSRGEMRMYERGRID